MPLLSLISCDFESMKSLEFQQQVFPGQWDLSENLNFTNIFRDLSLEYLHHKLESFLSQSFLVTSEELMKFFESLN